MANLARKMKRLKRWAKENVATYLHLLIYIVISSAFIYTNNLLLSTKQIKFYHYPPGLGFLQMASSSALWFIMMKVMKIRKVKDPDFWMAEKDMIEKHGGFIFVMGLTFAFSLSLRNGAYLYASSAFMQVLKTTLPVTVYAIEMENVFDSRQSRAPLYLSFIIAGVMVASYGEASFNLLAVACQMGSVICEAMRLILIDHLLATGGVQLNTVYAMYHLNFCSSLVLLVFFLVSISFDMLLTYPFWLWVLSVRWILILNCLLIFALNLQACLVISHMSALRFAQAKAIRDMIVVHLFPSLLADEGLILKSLIGYYIGVALLSLMMYFPLKEQALIEEERAEATIDSSHRRLPPSQVILKERARIRLLVWLGDLP